MVTRFEQFSSAVSAISRYIQKIERTEMAKYGLKGPHAQCLLAMSRYPEGVTASQLCEICDKDKAAISRTLVELETAGMILRPCPEGKRYRAQLSLTEKGRAIAQRVSELAGRAVDQASEGMTDGDRAVLYGALDLIAGNLQAICRDGIE